MSLAYFTGMFALGLVLLLFGGRALVNAAVAIAARLGVSPLLVGLTIVAWGTSAPELAFNSISAFKGRTDLVFGNLVGANICNIGLIIGVAALFHPLAVGDSVIRREIPVMAVTMVLAFAVAVIGAPGFSRPEGAILLTVFALYSASTIIGGLREHPRQTPLDEQVEHKHDTDLRRSLPSCVIGLVFGLALLGFGGSLAADGASGAAAALGVSPTIVGLTVVSIGTTLPELTTALIAVRKGHVDLAVGNALGSCMFNVACILGVVSIIQPVGLPENALVALGVMVGLCIVLVPMSRTASHRISRLEGASLLLVYAAFVGFQIASAIFEPHSLGPRQRPEGAHPTGRNPPRPPTGAPAPALTPPTDDSR